QSGHAGLRGFSYFIDTSFFAVGMVSGVLPYTGTDGLSVSLIASGRQPFISEGAVPSLSDARSVEVVAVWAVRTVIQFNIGDSIAENTGLFRMSKRLKICFKMPRFPRSWTKQGPLAA